MQVSVFRVLVPRAQPSQAAPRGPRAHSPQRAQLGGEAWTRLLRGEGPGLPLWLSPLPWEVRASEQRSPGPSRGVRPSRASRDTAQLREGFPEAASSGPVVPGSSGQGQEHRHLRCHQPLGRRPHPRGGLGLSGRSAEGVGRHVATAADSRDAGGLCGQCPWATATARGPLPPSKCSSGVASWAVGGRHSGANVGGEAPASQRAGRTLSATRKPAVSRDPLWTPGAPSPHTA